MRMMVVMAVVVLLTLLASMPLSSRAFDIHQIRQLAARNNVTSILVFGDSSVDPGNNNRLMTTFKSNFPPYGRDFFNGRPTGRFTNGRLATDFIAEAFGYTTALPAFLQPNLSTQELLHGVSFASAASGYDDLTANLTNVMSVSKQLQYLMHYKIQLRRMVGYEKAEEIIRNAIFILSMGTNDFLQNYFIEPIRSKQFNLEQYVDYLITCMTNNVKAMHYIGATRLAVVGVPPLGCLPIVKTLENTIECAENFNNASLLFNSKVIQNLATLRGSLGIRSAYIDIYGMLKSAINNPGKYGFTETSKGCCGTGTVEYGDTCKGLSTCEDPSKYVFWDAVHPSERMYAIIAVEAMKSLDETILF